MKRFLSLRSKSISAVLVLSFAFGTFAQAQAQAQAEDPYKTLGVSRKASAEEIKTAYRRLMKTAHTDRGGSLERAQQLNEAYETLSDETARARYDQRSTYEADAAAIRSQIGKSYEELKTENFTRIFADVREQVGVFRESGTPVTPAQLAFIGIQSLENHRHGFKFSNILNGDMREILDVYVLSPSAALLLTSEERIALAGAAIHKMQKASKDPQASNSAAGSESRIARYRYTERIDDLIATAEPKELEILTAVRAFYERSWQPVAVDIPVKRARLSPPPLLLTFSGDASASQSKPVVVIRSVVRSRDREARLNSDGSIDLYTAAGQHVRTFERTVTAQPTISFVGASLVIEDTGSGVRQIYSRRDGQYRFTQNAPVAQRSCPLLFSK